MTYRIAGDVSHLSPYETGPAAPLWWGMAGMIAVETAVFTILIVSYFHLAHGAAQWPLGGIKEPELLLPTLNTGVLIASSLCIFWADRGIRLGDKRRLSIGMIAASVLAVVFLVLKVVEYSDVGYRWDTNAYGSIVWVIIGFHSMHVFSLLLKSVVTTALSLRGYFTKERRLGVEINGLYWHFVTVVWIPLYLTLYWAPRVL